MGFLVPPRFLGLDGQRERHALSTFLREASAVANNISFLDRNGAITNNAKAGNIDGMWIVYTSNGTADTEDTIAHELGRLPVGMFVGLPDKAAVVYAGTTTWTLSNIYLRASVATVLVNILVF